MTRWLLRLGCSFFADFVAVAGPVLVTGVRLVGRALVIGLALVERRQVIGWLLAFWRVVHPSTVARIALGRQGLAATGPLSYGEVAQRLAPGYPERRSHRTRAIKLGRDGRHNVALNDLIDGCEQAPPRATPTPGGGQGAEHG